MIHGRNVSKLYIFFRTYVRNAYTYHLSEIFFTIVNEYTDWERTVQVRYHFCINFLIRATINPVRA